MTNRRFADLFGGPPREAGVGDHPARDGPRGVDPGRHRGGRAHDGARTPPSPPASANACLAGGVALNCVANGGCCARGRSSGSGSSPRRATPAAPSARRCTAGTRSSTSPRHADGVHDQMQRRVPRSALRRATRSRRWLDARGYPYERLTGDGARRAHRAVRSPTATSSAPAGAHGVRAARARAPLDHRRPALARRCSR